MSPQGRNPKAARFVILKGQQASVAPTGFSAPRGAPIRAGFMTAGPGGESTEGRDRSQANIELLREVGLRIDELKSVERSLGTPSEKPGDLDRARELAHRINNLLTSYRLRCDLRDSGGDI
jgi:hypothetical protein